VPGLQTDAGTVLLLAPDWRNPLDWLPALSAYIVGAPPRGDSCLALDAGTGPLPPAVVAGLVERACGYISEGHPFAEVLLAAGDTDDVERVASAPELVERLGLAVPRLRDDPLEVVLHARWVKPLVDDLQAVLDRALFEATPRPTLSGEPLVTVRIPTFGSVDDLIARAIPSVLAGAYQNVELLVCSDGPQPHARAAVEAVEDRRVRYLELPERPRYPSFPMSFWRVAGSAAVNALLDAARGDLIAPLDHDDAFTADHIPVLLDTLRSRNADMAYAMAMTEWDTGAWGLLGSSPMIEGTVVHATVMYTRRLAHMRYDRESWVLEEPTDWNLWQRARDAGAEIAFAPHPVAVHFKERTSIAGREAPQNAVAAFADDLLRTAAPLLGVASHLRGAAGLGDRRPRPAARRPRGDRRLAVIDTAFPNELSGFRYHEAAELLERRPDTAFFAVQRTREPWPRPVYPLHQLPRLAGPLGITDAYAVFLNLTASLLGLQDHPGAATCAGMLPDWGIARALASNKIRLHATIYPGGGLVAGTDPELLRAVGKRAATVFTNTAEVLAAIPGAIRVGGVMATGFYAFRERERPRPFRLVFAADARPRKGLDTALAALALLDERFHLHVVGPHAPVPDPRITFHGVLKPHALRSVYWACDVFVSPVRPEGPDGLPGEVGLVDGFPTTTASEALASGCALVSSNPRGEHWLLEPGEHFIEFPVGDAAALAAAVTRLEADRDLRDALARRGAARIRELMDVQSVVAAKLDAMGLAPVPA
jgi:hypothetical protein